MSEKPPFNKTDDELARLWQDQKLEGEKVPLEEIRKRARKFETVIRRRNLREYIAAAIVVVAFGTVTFRAPNILGRVGAGLIVVAAIYIGFSLYTSGSAQHVPDDAARMTIIRFHRFSLERRRDLLQDIWRWYLLPFVPGLVLLMFSAAVGDGVLLNPNRTPEQLRHGFALLTVNAMIFAFFFVVAALNKRAVRKLQRKIEALEGEESE